MKSSDKEVFLERQFKTNARTGTNYRTWKKLKDAELERDILKKAIGIFSKTVDDLYFHQNNEKIFPIEKMCKVLQVGQRSYWKKPVCFREKTKSWTC
jgi:hypothetical protein